MKRDPLHSKTCPRCKGRGWLVGRTAARTDANCLACEGRGWVPTGAAARDLALAGSEKWLAELLARGTAEAARKADATGYWSDASERGLIRLRATYRAVRASVEALRALPDNCLMKDIKAANDLALAA
jgi:hypothetical protein